MKIPNHLSNELRLIVCYKIAAIDKILLMFETVLKLMMFRADSYVLVGVVVEDRKGCRASVPWMERGKDLLRAYL